jgi:hypothetical protein
MKMILRRTVLLTAGLSMALGSIGCSSSSSSGLFGSDSSSGTLSAADREARSAALAELQRHWVKGPDGWTPSVTSGSAYAPDHFLRQYRDLTLDAVESQELSQSDRLNGFEWSGRVTFKHTVCREAGGQPTFVLDGMAEGRQAYAEKAPGRWSQWVDYTPGPMRFQKQKGQWQFQWDGSYLRSQLPGAADFAAAGVR